METFRNNADLLSIYLWIAIFIVQPHKEERFMYVIYPLLCYNSAHFVQSISNLLAGLLSRFFSQSCSLRLTGLANIILFSGYGVLSLARVLAQVRGFRAPLFVYTDLKGPSTLCIGKEWYRFPSSFFVPVGTKPLFVRSAFDGLLPGRFSESQWRAGMWEIPSGMNDQNLPEPSHLVSCRSLNSN
jgi:alpha-1,2-mannosyltransferase